MVEAKKDLRLAIFKAKEVGMTTEEIFKDVFDSIIEFEKQKSIIPKNILKEEIVQLMDEVGMSKNKGREYFIEAILYCATNRDMKFIQKYMYPYLEKKYNIPTVLIKSEMEKSINEIEERDIYEKYFKNRSISEMILNFTKIINSKSKSQL